jgi:GxxExxY protein
MTNDYLDKELTAQIIKMAINIHRTLGPGFVEKIYQRAMYLDLKRSPLKFEREKKINVQYKGVNLGYEKIDFIIENKVIVELKAVSEIQDVHKAKIISYLKASGCKIGLIINFARPIIEIKRVIYDTARKK